MMLEQKLTYNILVRHAVIVEEAAEVLEAHITASLNESTEHVILIGTYIELRHVVYNKMFQCNGSHSDKKKKH